MSGDLIYEIARFGVDSEAEQLVERIQLLSRDGVLWSRVTDGSEAQCATTDVPVVIAGDPSLNEVRANQVTRITASPEALRELPLLLCLPGHGSDVTESLWSGAMRAAHLENSCCADRDMCRVLYVNETRWGAFLTSEGESLLPEPDAVPTPPEGYDCAQPALMPCWATLTVEGGGPMTWCSDNTSIGLITPGVAAWVTNIADEGAQPVELRGCGDRATAIVEWLLDGMAAPWWGQFGDGGPLTQLFAEAASTGTATMECGMDSDGSGSIWTLKLDMEPALIKAVLDLLSQRNPDASFVGTDD